MALLESSAMTKILDFGAGTSHVGFFYGSLWSEFDWSGDRTDGTSLPR
jgi:hypothetical protein